MRPFADGAAPCRKRAPLSPMMETLVSPDAKVPSELEASKFIEYPRQAYITICGKKCCFDTTGGVGGTQKKKKKKIEIFFFFL